jgi:hypothetical protein
MCEGIEAADWYAKRLACLTEEHPGIEIAVAVFKPAIYDVIWLVQ